MLENLDAAPMDVVKLHEIILFVLCFTKFVYL